GARYRALGDGADGPVAAEDRGAGADDPARPTHPVRRATAAAIVAAGVRTTELFPGGAGGLRAVRRRHGAGSRSARQVAARLRRPGPVGGAPRRRTRGGRRPEEAQEPRRPPAS